ncbi:MAG: type II secretion system F family protein [Rhodocyclales bacterium]|nr:type II secretion system F family protein [Rhodocyclales bacterium]
MAHFAYTGRNAQGGLTEGTLESASAAALADHLVTLGVTPIRIDPVQGPQEGALAQLARLRERGQVGHVDILMFSRQMYTLLKAGVPIMRALAGLQESCSNRAFAAVIRDLRESLDSGRELSQAMARQPRAFSPFYISMVRVGESTGRLEEIFISLFHHLEFQQFMRNQVKSALRYPSFVVGVMALALVIINIFVIPQFTKVFKSLKAELPFMTKVIIASSDFFVAWWPVMLLAMVGAVVGFRLMVASKEGRFAWDRFKLRIPIAGSIVNKATLARFARGLALGLKSGVPAVQALTLTAQVVENDYLAKKIEDMRLGVERGESILRTAIAAKIFTPVVLQMVMVGEESGALDDMMEEVGDMYQREVEYELKNLSAQIEPILIVFLGVIVLILALGVFLPMWDLGRAMIK